MSTRATIAIRRTTGDYLATYLHFDGYPEHAGRLLESNYLSYEQAEALIAKGDIRCLDAELGEPEYYDAEAPAAVLPTRIALVEFARNCSSQYLYVFDAGEWTHQKL
ncbi:hypothetical protein [Novipirellula caenicola]|uniref:DUF4258 domain-containing protein n=1 Tax=Novipirellula caenicola TaxID=1536901 RepID=A0ABP9VYA0_9BACT